MFYGVATYLPRSEHADDFQVSVIGVCFEFGVSHCIVKLHMYVILMVRYIHAHSPPTHWLSYMHANNSASLDWVPSHTEVFPEVSSCTVDLDVGKLPVWDCVYPETVVPRQPGQGFKGESPE